MRHIVMAVVLGWASVCFAAGAGPAQKWEYAVYSEFGTRVFWQTASGKDVMNSDDIAHTRAQFCAKLGGPQQSGNMADVLNAAGRMGWELVAVTGTEPIQFILKRPAP